ncbi:hypothetical protein DFH09DRAFT_1097374 [Mycena vulgaris]|nr:hypothetical protein DFH09DRAFT_1097374 [Mycena vulgaris]
MVRDWPWFGTGLEGQLEQRSIHTWRERRVCMPAGVLDVRCGERPVFVLHCQRPRALWTKGIKSWSDGITTRGDASGAPDTEGVIGRILLNRGSRGIASALDTAPAARLKSGPAEPGLSLREVLMKTKIEVLAQYFVGRSPGDRISDGGERGDAFRFGRAQTQRGVVEGTSTKRLAIWMHRIRPELKDLLPLLFERWVSNPIRDGGHGGGAFRR